MVLKYCFECKCERDFNNLNDSDCNRCEECLSLPYTKEQWEIHNKPIGNEND